MKFVKRYHDFCAGHRVVGHEGKCRHLHGHNYRVHFTVCSEDELYGTGPALDSVGRVIDFSVVKSTLCQWLEDNWDHKMLIWNEDLAMVAIHSSIENDGDLADIEDHCLLDDSIVWVPFNPTAENMGDYLVKVIGPKLLGEHGMVLQSVEIEETRKCSVICEKDI